LKSVVDRHSALEQLLCLNVDWRKRVPEKDEPIALLKRCSCIAPNWLDAWRKLNRSPETAYVLNVWGVVPAGGDRRLARAFAHRSPRL
jgi:hypothetical protein